MKARTQAAEYTVIAAVTSWECYSKSCPDFIVVNKVDLTVRIDGTKTFGRDAAGLYVLNILTQDAYDGEIVLLEEFIIFIEDASEKEESININMPWDIWVKQNAGNLPFSVGKQPDNVSENMLSAMIDARENAQARFDPVALREIMSWTDEEFTEAYTEAQERMDTQYVEVVVDITISNQGEIKIDFSPAITFPSYMLRAFDEFIATQPGYIASSNNLPEQSRRRLNEQRLL